MCVGGRVRQIPPPFQRRDMYRSPSLREKWIRPNLTRKAAMPEFFGIHYQPYRKTDTGRQVEKTKVNGLILVKELGKTATVTLE